MAYLRLYTIFYSFNLAAVLIINGKRQQLQCSEPEDKRFTKIGGRFMDENGAHLTANAGSAGV